jgi:hypothetical protein
LGWMLSSMARFAWRFSRSRQAGFGGVRCAKKPEWQLYKNYYFAAFEIRAFQSLLGMLSKITID